jgi:hypothetical protein
MSSSSAPPSIFASQKTEKNTRTIRPRALRRALREDEVAAVTEEDTLNRNSSRGSGLDDTTAYAAQLRGLQVEYLLLRLGVQLNPSLFHRLEVWNPSLGEVTAQVNAKGRDEGAVNGVYGLDPPDELADGSVCYSHHEGILGVVDGDALLTNLAVHAKDGCTCLLVLVSRVDPQASVREQHEALDAVAHLSRHLVEERAVGGHRACVPKFQLCYFLMSVHVNELT